MAVFITRKIGTDIKSALYGRISVAPKCDPLLTKLNQAADWRVSTAVIVEGVLKLISSNPKRDTNAMLTPKPKPRSALALGAQGRTPFRQLYLDGNDKVLYMIVINYVNVCQRVFWANAGKSSFITRTVGVQALFDVLRLIGRDAYEAKDISADYFSRRLQHAGGIDFSADLYRNASGSGRSIIRRAIEQRLF